MVVVFRTMIPRRRRKMIRIMFAGWLIAVIGLALIAGRVFS
jgi:hypothetical protein